MDGSSAEKFLEKLRAADERTKQRIIIVTSIICMIIIIFIWIASFSILIAPGAGAGGAAASAAQPAAAQSSGPGFWDSVKNDANGIYQKFAGGLNGALQGSKQYTIQPQQ